MLKVRADCSKHCNGMNNMFFSLVFCFFVICFFLGGGGEAYFRMNSDL